MNRDMPLTTSADFADVEQLKEVVPEANGLALQLDPGALSLQIDAMETGRLAVQRLANNKSLMLESHLEDRSSIILCAPSDTRPPLWCGVPVEGAVMALSRSGREHVYRVPAGWHDIQVSLGDDLLYESGILTERTLDQAMSPERGQIPIDERVLQGTLSSLSAIIERGRAGVATQSTVQRLEESVVEGLREAVENGSGHSGSTSGVRPSRRYALVRRAFEYFNEERVEAQTVEALSEALSTNRQTLHRAFRDTVGVSPYQFMLRMRLNATRRALHEDSANASITQIASAHGFCSSSEFAFHYRRFYGELPSKTLRRQDTGAISG